LTIWIIRIQFSLHIQIRRVGREEAMKVAMLVGMLMFNVIAGLYERGWAATDGGLSDDAGQVRACDDIVPPPPNWP
jgi:hypothetical protein